MLNESKEWLQPLKRERKKQTKLTEFAKRTPLISKTMFKEKYKQHEKELEKLDKWEYWLVKLIPFLLSFLFIYLLCKIL